MKKSKAFIIGGSGQIGSYIVENFLSKGLEVWVGIRRHSVSETQTSRLNHIFNDENLKFVYIDITDQTSITNALNKINPDFVVNCAAQSHVKISFDLPVYTANVDGMGVLNLLESIRQCCPTTRLITFSTSEMFGNSVSVGNFQSEDTPMHPVSPYGCAKLMGYSLIRNYRNSYGMFASNIICFNTESPRRGENFVTTKVVKGAIDILNGKTDKLELGNLEAARDWQNAKDVAEATWLILNHDKPDDFVIASGVSHTIKDLCEYVFSKLGMSYQDYVISTEKFLRPEELNYLKGDSTKARKVLNWNPKYNFEQTIDEMIEYWKTKI